MSLLHREEIAQIFLSHGGVYLFASDLSFVRDIEARARKRLLEEIKVSSPTHHCDKYQVPLYVLPQE